MKILNIFLFILLANTTYRCAEDENTIDCNSAVQQMLGRWEGASNYTQPSSARGVTQKFAIDITSADGCMFYGISSFEDSFTTFSITVEIDKYGWVEFRETEYAHNDGDYTDCQSNGSSWNNPCNRWPYVRWRPGTKFHEARFRSEPYVLNGEFFTQGGGWNSQIRGNFTITK